MSHMHIVCPAIERVFEVVCFEGFSRCQNPLRDPRGSSPILTASGQLCAIDPAFKAELQILHKPKAASDMTKGGVARA